MFTLRRAEDRGHADHGWLLSHHTFSFADYHDPRHMGFRSLRVINEDFVKPTRGFGTHPHHDMEILTWVLDGELAHEDSMGFGAVIRPGEIQRMSAGTGVLHSELNPSAGQAVHLLQIWIVPESRGLQPGYEQRRFSTAVRRGRLCTLAARDGRDGAVTIHQDATLASALLAPGESVSHELAPGRAAWLQVARGSVTVRGDTDEAPASPDAPVGAQATMTLRAGDGVAVEAEQRLHISAAPPSGAACASDAFDGSTGLAEILLFDLA